QDGSNGIVPLIRDRLLGVFIQNLTEVTPHHLYVYSLPIANSSFMQLCNGVAAAIDKINAAHAGVGCFYFIQNLHPLRYLDGGAPYIDSVPAESQSRAALNNGHGISVASQPVGKRRPSDGCALDQDTLPHIPSLRRRRSRHGVGDVPS